MSEVHFNTLPQWLEWIESSHPVDKIELGLDRLRKVFTKMALDFSSSRIVIVGGTNGKGSTIAMLDQVLRDHSKSVGCFTSPHFLRYNERIKLGGQPVSDTLIVRAFEAIEQCRGGVPLTYFEYNTLAALHVFATEQPDVMLLEVGLGGRLDAINIVDAEISVVTTVSVDHVDWLGDDREQIGYEKAGIYRHNCPAVCGDPNPPQQLVSYANEIGAELYLRGRDFNLVPQDDKGWIWQGKQVDGSLFEISGLPELTLPEANAATVIQVLQLLDMMPQSASLGLSLKSASLMGRMQIVSISGIDYILDVAHNPEAAEYLAEQLCSKPVEGRTLMVLGMLADKDIDEVLRHLKPIVDCWYLAGLDVPRGQSALALSENLNQQGVNVTPQSAYDTVQVALKAVEADVKPGDRVIIAGSFFTVSAALTALNMDDKE
ncbi:MAG: bifunctional tetrahydrofolate synthase/dihydrofolate synthase [Amphritea sp.]|nr:bifunctional tetrahydrofolate synthase/dihydrofolate synthase [Amphritea sp.]